MELVQLFEVKPRSKVRLHVPDQDGDIVMHDLFFDHIDGMYSYCIDEYGNVVHPAAWTMVEVLS